VALTAAQRVDTGVARHTEDPRRELAAKAEARQVLVEAEKGLLRHVLCQGGVVEQVAQEAPDVWLELADQPFERGHVARGRRPDDCGLGFVHAGSLRQAPAQVASRPHGHPTLRHPL